MTYIEPMSSSVKIQYFTGILLVDLKVFPHRSDVIGTSYKKHQIICTLKHTNKICQGLLYNYPVLLNISWRTINDVIKFPTPPFTLKLGYLAILMNWAQIIQHCINKGMA